MRPNNILTTQIMGFRKPELHSNDLATSNKYGPISPNNMEMKYLGLLEHAQTLRHTKAITCIHNNVALVLETSPCLAKIHMEMDGMEDT